MMYSESEDGLTMGIIENFGEAAGRIWRELDQRGSLNQNRLLKTVDLDEKLFFTAVGWLARENKISQYGLYYKLCPSNLEGKIGPNAGKLLHILTRFGGIDELYLPLLAELSKEEVYTALGWLAREGKVSAEVFQPTQPQICYYINSE
jgi:hypothetical protein